MTPNGVIIKVEKSDISRNLWTFVIILIKLQSENSHKTGDKIYIYKGAETRIFNGKFLKSGLMNST